MTTTRITCGVCGTVIDRDTTAGLLTQRLDDGGTRWVDVYADVVVHECAEGVERPKGGIEQARRNLMRDDPDLYAYIEARVAARELERAADDCSGACDEYGAANRVYAMSARWEQKWRGIGEHRRNGAR